MAHQCGCKNTCVGANPCDSARVLMFEDDRLKIVQGGVTVMSFCLNQVTPADRHQSKQIEIAPGERYRVFGGAEAITVFLFPEFINYQPGDRLYIAQNEYDPDGNDLGLGTPVQWKPLASYYFFECPPQYPIRMLDVFNPLDRPVILQSLVIESQPDSPTDPCPPSTSSSVSYSHPGPSAQST